jgi:transposase
MSDLFWLTGIEPCIPLTKSRKRPLPYDKVLYKQRHKVENMFHASRTGGALQHATTDALKPSSQASASPLLSASISINES